MRLATFLILALALPILAAENRWTAPAERRDWHLFWASAGTKSLASAADAWSSWDWPRPCDPMRNTNCEQNPLLRSASGQFDARSAAIKGALSVGSTGLEYLTVRLLLVRRPRLAGLLLRLFSVGNLGVTVSYSVAAGRNTRYRNSLPPTAP